MSRRVIVRAAAEADLIHATEWYESKRKGLAEAFLDELTRTVESIRERPESFPIDYRELRRALVRRFPYAVHLAIRNDEVVILAVLHHRQDKSRNLPDRF